MKYRKLRIYEEDHRANDEDNIDVNTFNTIKKELKLLKDQTSHRLAKLEDTVSTGHSRNIA